MEEIEVGDWIRTKKGNMDKIACEFDKNNWRSKNTYGELIVRCLDNIYLLDDIVKHSKNIIDLIEVGDYVNGQLVRATYLEGVTKYIKLNNSRGVRTYNDNIKTILTHEQYIQNCYTVERSVKNVKNKE